VTTTVRRTRLRRGEGARLRDEILDAATALLSETGDVDAVTIRAVAQAVGVTPPSVYMHFPDKDALVFAVCERQFCALEAFIESEVADIADPVEQLRERAVAYVRFGLEHAEQYRMLFMLRPGSSPSHPDLAAVMRCTGYGKLHDNVERIKAAGRLRTDDTASATLSLWVAVHGLTSLLIAKPAFPWPADPESMVRQMSAHHLDGLLA
jgi:AcrR family transcriptional regulator